MKIIYKKTFEKQLIQIIDYIAKDKVGASISFANELEKLIFLIQDNPYQYRKSIYFSSENIRDMIYKGYTINYKINLQKNQIEILRVFNKNRPPKK